jgi:hypothetical protein
MDTKVPAYWAPISLSQVGVATGQLDIDCYFMVAIKKKRI